VDKRSASTIAAACGGCAALIHPTKSEALMENKEIR